MSNSKEKIWTPSFFILWQGQLFSTLGDTAYSIALGFWVLSVTGSTALMGTLMAASTLPGVLVSPFAGVLVDRKNRKNLLILMDFIRGISIVLIGIAAYRGFLAIWMVFAAGIILSICGAFFRPGVNSCIPDLVPKSLITNANSIFAVVGTGASMLGNAAGGYLYMILGAPFMFLFNGLSFLFSGSSIFFINIPKIKKDVQQTFINDLKEGFSFVWKLKGLKYMLFIAAYINFFFNIALVLLLPLFQRTPGLDSGKYGVVMASFMGAAMLGFLVTSIINIPASKRFSIFIVSNIIWNVCIIVFVNINILGVMIAMCIIAGVFNSLVNVFVMSSLQITTPQEMRGKVMAVMSMVTQGLTPFAMALGGVLGDMFPLKYVITLSLAIVLFTVTPFTLNKPLKKFINYDPDKNTLDDIM